MKLYYLPNAITFLRIALAPVLIVALDERNYGTALLIFLVAGLSDSLDGFIAKRYNLVTRLGTILDPLADKILLLSAYIMLAILGHLPLWLVLTVGFRDLVIVAGYLMYTSLIGSLQIRPTYLSKFNTFLQIALVILILVQETAGLQFAAAVQYIVWGVFLTTVTSCAHYLWIWGVKRHPEAVGESKEPSD